jgi:hypothetical protein
MTDNVNVSPTGGTPSAADDIGGVLHQRVKAEYGPDGSATDVSGINPLPVSVAGENPAYRLFIPPAAAGASKVYFDLFNATGSGKSLRVLSVVPIVSGKSAVTGVVAVDLYLTRTTAVGTGGTAATAEGTSLTAPGLAKLDPSDASLPAQVTARAAPTGGGTAGAVIAMESLFTEETSPGTYLSSMCDFVRRALGPAAPPLLVPENSGIRVVQDSVASVGNIGFDVIFEVV